MTLHPAHHSEDLTLSRLLSTVDKGYYIDIGANDPYRNSNSHSFYERGWRGVDVEPNPRWVSKLKLAHPDNRVLNLAVGAEETEVDFFIPDLCELHWQQIATTKQEWVALSKKDRPDEQWSTIKVQQVTMDWIFSQISNSVDFVSIDVEGSEAEVIAGWTVSRYQPTVLCIEAVTPIREPQWDLWEAKLLPFYNFVHFDTLNRFYTRK